MANEKRLVFAAEVKDLINGLDALPWEEEVDYLVDSLSTVDAVEVVHGRWIDDRWTKWQCDKCHSPSPAYGYPRREYVKTRYCPNCGAKMDGDGNG